MILKDYQRRTLTAVDDFLTALSRWREKDAQARDFDPEIGFDWVERAWRECTPRRYTARTDGSGRVLPAFCLKVPTGGGKTLIAINVIDRVNVTFRLRQTGMVLWIVPSTQIYRQTLSALRDRGHFYRQRLDVASGGRTLIREKTDGFSPRDVAENLCVLMLMLPSANRETKEQLRMFRDSGGFDQFFPDQGDPKAHEEILGQTPNLDTFDVGHELWGPQIKTSLGNTLRLLRPLVILDEGHKTYGRLARGTIEGFNPCAVVELSATPAPEANVLVEILGQELLAEEMIKLDLHIHCREDADWRDTLLAAADHRQRLEDEAREYEGATGTRIRPICVIQVERTGRDQRGAGFVHAEDVREYLQQSQHIQPHEIAVKSSAKDELKEVDDIGGLLSPDCQIRYIITKQALQEGWDCPFAYVLAILTRPSSQTGLTQLVGRILRQPYARKTNVSALDESYVFCFRRRGAEMLKQVRRGFGKEGLGDLGGRIVDETDDQALRRRRTTRRQRDRFQEAVRDLVLPAFMIDDRDRWRPVRYEADILSRVDWAAIDVSPLFDLALGDSPAGGLDLRVGLESSSRFAAETGQGDSGATLDYALATNHLIDLVPNPWLGYDLAKRLFGELLKRHPAKQVHAHFVHLLGELRRQVAIERDRLAQAAFGEMLDSGRMRFLVAAEDFGFNRLPREIEAPEGKQANRDDGGQFELNLFERTDEDEFNILENKVATYLDRQERLFFWYRNRSRKDYYVQGWQRGRIYADFILTLKPDEPSPDDPFHRVFVLETKGLHLEEATDTSYKRSVFDLCNEHARRADWAEFVPAMRGRPTRFEVVDEKEWEQRLTALLATD